MGSKLKIFAALNVAGWLIAVPVLVIALATPWVSYKDWPESLLKQERDSAIALGKARERDAAARETVRPARRTQDARPAGQRSAGDQSLTVAAVGETQRPGASVPQRSAGAAPRVATPNPVRRLSNQPRSNSPRGVAQNTPVAPAPVTSPPPRPQPAATQPPASEQPARERRNRGRRNGDRQPTPAPTVHATEVPQEPEEDGDESQDRGDGGWNEDRQDESDRDRRDWGSKHDDGEQDTDDDDDRWRGDGGGDDDDGDTGD
jgi:hypothetical protein